jgi:nucleoside-diphosphate-sugar epimerase
MRVAVIGATGVIGRSVVPTLLAAGHDVVGLARTPEKARLLTRLGAEPSAATSMDHQELVGMFDGVDAVCNFATHVPAGLAALRPHAWAANDRLRSVGVRRVVEAARDARVRRIVQESVSFLYADQGDLVVTEESPVAITPATEPASVGESVVQGYSCGSRTGVVLRFGTLVADDPGSRLQLRSARYGHALGPGSLDGWAHVVHVEDVGPAVLAALGVPSGIYNVGAEPVRRADLMAGLAAGAGRDGVDFVGPLLRRLGGVRLEPLGRSLRVSSQLFTSTSGWTPARARFDASWFSAAQPSEALR